MTECAPHALVFACSRIKHDDTLIPVAVRNVKLVGRVVHEQVCRLVNVYRVDVAAACPTLADLHDELAVVGELQNHVVGATVRSHARPAAVAADPYESLPIDPDAVLALGPVVAVARAAPALDQCSVAIELEHWGRGTVPLFLGDGAWPVQHPDMPVRRGRDRRDLAEHPVIRHVRPAGIDAKGRRARLCARWRQWLRQNEQR